MRYIK